MVMDSQFGGFSDGVNSYQFVSGAVSPGMDEPLNYSHLFDYKDPSLNLNLGNPPSPKFEVILNDLYTSHSNGTPEVHSPSDSDSDPVLKYLNHMLMEENMDEKPCRFQDSLALQAAERPFNDAPGQKYPDSPNGGFSDGVNSYQFVSGAVSPGMDEPLNYSHLFDYKDPSLNLNLGNPPSPKFEVILNDLYTSHSNGTPEVHSPSDSYSDPVLKYLNHMLMEENMDEKPCRFQDSLALQAAERPFNDALGQKYPDSPNQRPLVDHFVESPDDTSSEFTAERSGTTSSGNKTNYINPVWITDLRESEPSLTQTPVGYSIHKSTIPQVSSIPLSSLSSAGNGSINSYCGMPLDLNFLTQRESIIQFQKGAEEASKFLPKNINVVIDPVNMTFTDESMEAPAVMIKLGREVWPDGLRGRKVHYCEDDDFEDGRSRKQSAVSLEVCELSEMLDKVLLRVPDEDQCAMKLESQKGEGHSLEQNGQPQGSKGSKCYSKKQVNDKNVVDLGTLLILCAQAIASDDRRTADELLKQIWEHSSPEGDGSQRLAHYFANALEARLAGTGSQIYTTLASKRATATDGIKAHRVYFAACPFKGTSMAFAVHMILKAAQKATKLHIIDFGILYGFQWPILIQLLSKRPGGPPKLCITGIDLPLPGFRPAERVEATGRRLAKYCECFNVPFEYHAIAQKWETIKIEDLKINGDGVVAVNCLYGLKNLLDETVVVDSPRNAVLNLIREINPDIFVNTSVNGSFSSPFLFISRFREALFHFSTLFDMFDANIRRDLPERLMFEKEFYGREIMNVVACEGTERVERPETYRQWQVRITKAGFKQLPFFPEFIKKSTMKARKYYHKDFLIDVDGHWVLQGWKGRVVCATSAWVPS